ncbi:MAG TPA: arginine--tRNA ligase [Candidatus Deferrimicrobiaceae bacterium]|nr:arginine--tRNA ligase [Candidatus Deferrimicrobiaceae bacterium]
MNITDHLTDALRHALAAAGLPAPTEVQWEVPREARHGDYATNAAMALAREARRAPRKIAEAVVANFPKTDAVERLEIAGPGFLNVFLSPRWCADGLHRVLAAGDDYGLRSAGKGARVLLEFVSANPTGPLVIVNARAAAVGDALARILRSQGYAVESQYYVNDAGNQFVALARSVDVRLRQALGEAVELPENAYPGEYLIELVAEWLARDPQAMRALAARPEAERIERLGRLAVDAMVESQRRVLEAYGTRFDRWAHEQRDVRDANRPQEAIAALTAAGHTYEQDGALWFRSTPFGDDKDRVLRKSDGELTYFAVDIGFHHLEKFRRADHVIDFLGPDHHGYVPRMRAAMQALGHAPERFDVLIVQLVTLLRDGQPVRMSKRRGEFVLMEELLEEVGRDAARFTFLTRRHDSPLEFDLAVATRQSSDNPVFYVQYAHARVASLFRTAAEQGVAVPPWAEVDFAPLALAEEQALIKHLLQFPELVAGAARAREPHRVAYYLTDLAGFFHPYYKAHRVITPDRASTLARLGLCAAVGQVVRNGLTLLGVGAPESMSRGEERD